MFVVILRTVVLYGLVVITMRIMGKRQIGELQPYELAVAIMIADLAAVPMEDTGIPLLYGVIPIFLVLAVEVLLSILSMKSIRAREFINGRPSIVIRNGKLVLHELERLRLNINDVLEQLRIAGYPNIADVEFALLETNGKFSVLPKSQKRPLNPADLNIPTRYEGLSYPLVLDGRVEENHLREMGLTEEWLAGQLRSLGVDDFSELILASLDSDGNLFYQKKEM